MGGGGCRGHRRSLRRRRPRDHARHLLSPLPPGTSGELALDAGGKMTGLRVRLLSDHGAFFADAQPGKFRAGLFHIVTGSYDIPAAHISATGVHTNKAPGGIAYRCSFRVTEASFLIERLVTTAAC